MHVQVIQYKDAGGNEVETILITRVKNKTGQWIKSVESSGKSGQVATIKSDGVVIGKNLHWSLEKYIQQLRSLERQINYIYNWNFGGHWPPLF